MFGRDSWYRYVPSISQLFYAFLITSAGLTLGKWLAFLFDGSSFAALQSASFIAKTSFGATSSTVMAMKRVITLLPVCFAASCVTSIFVTALKEKELVVNFPAVLQKSWRIGIILSGLVALLFGVASVLTIVDVAIALGREIPFLGALFSLIYGLIYPLATLVSFVLILLGYFVALGPLHAVGIIEQERLQEADMSSVVTLKMIVESIKTMIVESATAVRSVLICGWTFGVIPLFCYQLFLLSTLNPVPPQDGLGLNMLQNITLSISTSVVEAPFLLVSFFCSFFFVARARDASSL